MATIIHSLIHLHSKPPCKEKFKATMIGNYGVGKTSLIHRFHNRSLKTDSTIGCSFSVYKHTFDGNQLQINLWDTAGQERYRSLIDMYFKDIDICILVYDLTQPETLLQLIDYWIPRVLDANHYTPLSLYIVGNKSDIYFNHPRFNLLQEDNVQLTEHIRNRYKNDKHLLFHFYQVSAIDNINVNELLTNICSYCEHQYWKPTETRNIIPITPPRPRSWFNKIFPCLS